MKRICLVGFLFLIFTLVFLSCQVHAVDAFDVKIKTNSISSDQVLYPGDSVVVMVSFDHFQGRQIHAYQARLVYDTNIFAEVDENNFVSMGDWSFVHYNKRNGSFVSYHKSGVKAEQDIFQITLKVKNTISFHDITNIEITDVVATDGIKDLYANDESISFTVSSLSQSNVVDTNYKENTPFVHNYVSNQHKSFDNAYKFSPYFGYYLLIFITIFIFILLIILYRKREEKHGICRMLVFTFMFGAFVLQFFGITCEVVVAFAGRGELTGNDIIDYSDVLLLESHLTSLIPLSNESLKNADMNVDGKVTVTDLALLVQKIERVLPYEVSLSSIETSPLYISKDEEILLTFQASINYSAIIKKVVINERTYDVSFDGNTYKTFVPATSKAGQNHYMITAVILDSGRKVDVDYQFAVETLKDRPSIYQFVQSDSSLLSELYFDFYMIDSDQSFVSGKMVLVDSIDGSKREIPIHGGRNHITFSVLPNRNYLYQIFITYDRNSNREDNLYLVSDEIIKTDSVFLSSSSLFHISNAYLLTNTISKGEKAFIRFNFENISEYLPVSVMINGEGYPLQKDENGYFTSLDGFTKSGEFDLLIEKVILENDKVVSFDAIPLKVYVLKDKPTIEFRQKEDASKLKVDMDVSVIDDDSSFLNGKVVLKKGDGSIQEKEIYVGDNHITFALENATHYSYSLQITYDRDIDVFRYDYLVVGEVLKTGDLFLMNDYKLTISNVTVNKEYGVSSYFERGERAIIRFQSSNISSFIPVKAVISGKKYELIEKNGFYETELVVAKKSGIKKLTIDKIVLSNRKVISFPKKKRKKVRLEVLKREPSLYHFKRKDNSMKSTLQFSILDLDDAFVGGKVLLKGEDGTVLEKKIKKGDNSITFSLVDGVLYTYQIFITYDRDSNKVDNINLVTDKVFRKGNVMLRANI